LTIQLSTYAKNFKTVFMNNYDSSTIRIFRNKNQIQKFKEKIFFLGKYNFWGPLITADFNGDSLPDIKLNIAYMGCGLASLNARVIYLFQTNEGKFIKVSFLDMLGNGNRIERDIDGEGNYEIITMNLEGYENHNYWTFNLYNFKNGNLKCVNEKFDYPIMIQYLNKENYKITDKISKEKMKTFSKKLPNDYDAR